MTSRIVIGSRGSQLALVQSEWVKAKLERLNSGLEIVIEVIKTTGDVVQQAPLSQIGGKGVFTKELEDALLDGRVDLAVHSLKDLPTIVQDKLAITAICEREDPRDALVLPAPSSFTCNSLNDLKAHSVVGTSSPRRLAQLQRARPDLVFKELRGNVDTRLRKLDEGQYDALLLAAAGLRRLGLTDRVSLAIDPAQMLPAVGQGALGLQTRSDDAPTNAIVGELNHPDTSVACEAERAFLRALGGGCQLPIAAHAVVAGEIVTVDGLVASRDGKTILRDQISGFHGEADRLGTELAAKLLAGGARELIGN
ncbi:MAG TPA: hydroxymethylbilane synthase [Pyrinomonadaceae bacterium]|nr:hydroxymethylbilane synthase [Pyrinomonadaceae bacterium]